MSNKFDQLAKGVAESVTRRQALKRFAGGLVGIALAGFALSAKAECIPNGGPCDPDAGAERHDSCNRCCAGFGTPNPDKNNDNTFRCGP